MAMVTDIALSATGDVLLENNDIQMVYSDDLAVQIFNIMFRSDYGDFVTFPHLAMNLKEFMQQSNTEENAQALEDRIQTSVEDVDIFNDYSVITESYPTDRDDLRLDISLINPDNQLIDINLNVDLVHGSVTGLSEFTNDMHNIYESAGTIRVEKMKIDKATQTFNLYIRPRYTTDGYNIEIYKADEFYIDDVDAKYTESITLTNSLYDTISSNMEIDLKTTDTYTNILSKKNVTTLYINNYLVNVSELESNNWKYSIDENALTVLKYDGVIEIEAYYNNAFTTGTITNTTFKQITNDAIAPEIEDNRVYTITAHKQLPSGSYFVKYDSYSIRS